MIRSIRSARRAGALLAVAAFLTACSEQQPLATEPVDQVDGMYNLDATWAGLPATPGIGVNASPVPGPGQTELVVNGSFEDNSGRNSGNFAGWSVYNEGSGGWYAQAGTSAPPPFAASVVAPPHGTFAAMTSQGGPGTHFLTQNIVLPAGSEVTLSLKLWYHNWGGRFVNASHLRHFPGSNQRMQIDVMLPSSALGDLGAGVLMNVFATQPGDALVLPGYISVTADLSAFAGQTVRLRIAEVDNGGFFHGAVDDVSIIAESSNQAPTADAGVDQIVECTGAATDVQLDGTAADTDGNIASVEWFDGSTLVASGEDPIVSLAHGTHTLTMVVTDASGATASDEVIVDITDTTAPTLSVSATPGELWPPNHQYVPVDLAIAVSDNCDAADAVTVTASAISSDADDARGNGDGATSGDVKAAANVSSNDVPMVVFNPATDQLELRAERAGRSGDRTYTITVTATDSHGNSSTAATTVTVAHNK